MKFYIAQVTFDPNNFVNTSDFLKNELEKLVNKRIFKKVELEDKYKNWKFFYTVSSNGSCAKKGHIGLTPSKSFKLKIIEHYVFFPKLSKHQKYNYNKRKFVKFFFEGLRKILKVYNFNDDGLLEECLKYSLAHIITDPNAEFKDDNIYLSKKQIAKILRSK